jgi:hypothetical protein
MASMGLVGTASTIGGEDFTNRFPMGACDFQASALRPNKILSAYKYQIPHIQLHR